jgi:hypothetical protein
MVHRQCSPRLSDSLVLALKSHDTILLEANKMVVFLHILHWFDMLWEVILPIEEVSWL